jgi:tetratricopeptide (TPR) repeat protein
VLMLGTVAGCSTGSTSIRDEDGSRATAVAAFDNRQYDKAIQFFMEQLKSGVQDEHKIWFNIGAAHWNLGQQSDALEAYGQAVAVNPLYLKAHNRLGAHYFLLGRKDQAASHAKVVAAIKRVDRMFATAWEKAHAMRARGAVYFKAVAKLHDTAAQQYEKLGLPAQAEAERKLAEKNHREEIRERQQPMQEAQRVQAEAEERAFNVELLGTVKDLSATIMKVEPNTSIGDPGLYGTAGGGMMNASSTSLGGDSGRMAIYGLGAAEQVFGTYAEILNAYGSQLQSQRQEVYQQGLSAQAALADPAQAKIQNDARKRTESLMKKLEETERLAIEYLVEQGELDGVREKDDRDTLDL